MPHPCNTDVPQSGILDLNNWRLKALNDKRTLTPILFLLSLLLAACGTLDVGIEGTAAADDQAAATPAALATENARLSAEITRLAETPAATPLPLAWTTIVSSSRELQGEAPEGCTQVGWNVWECPGELIATQTITATPSTQSGSVVITGTVAALDFPDGWAYMVPEMETAFADANGMVRAKISEWSGITAADGSIFAREDLSKGARLEVTATLQDEGLIADQVVVLSPGVPRPEDNPAYTDVTGRVTPIAEPPQSGDGAIQLFEAASEYTIVDPGAAVTLSWAFEGEYGTICERITPRPLSDTCYQDLPSSGSLEVTVPAEARGAIGYFLYVQANEVVEDAMVILSLSAERGCEYAWFFGNAEYAHKPLLECPSSEPVEIRPQAQLFEKGLMLRLEDATLGEDAWLIALLPQEGGFYSLGFEPVVDSWTPGMPETDAALSPPEGLFQPSRGFGMLWRGEIEHRPMGESQTLDGEGVLGWATGNVLEYDAAYQCLESTHGRARSCFIGGPDGNVLPMPVTW